MKMQNVKCDCCGRKYIKAEKYVRFNKKNGHKNYCSQDCFNKSKETGEWRICANCGKEIFVTQSRLKKSKSKNVFCSRSCSITYRNKNSDIGYNYKTGISVYREKAFDFYNHQCAICKYNDIVEILQVHHIDEDRDNNNIENLIILCPNCHRAVHHQFITVTQYIF